MVITMITFEQFVESLGTEAHQYTPGELRELHREVKMFANIIIAANRNREQKAVIAQQRQEDRIQELPL